MGKHNQRCYLLATMGRPQLISISPYPLPNNGISKYASHYFSALEARGYAIKNHTLYFWQKKLTNFKWFGYAFAALFNRRQVYLIQHTPTLSGPLILFFLLVTKWLGISTVLMSHETPSTYAKYLKGLFKSLYLLYEKSVVNLSAHYIVHTRFHKNELDALKINKAIQVLPLPIYQSSGSVPENERKRWGFYGQITPKKGLDLLIDAYQAFPPGEFPQLFIMGRAAGGHESYTEDLKQRVNHDYREYIHFTGYVDEKDKPILFSKTALMIFPYRWISQSAALSETCLYETPYLASDIPFFKEFQETYGCGRTIKAESLDALKKALAEYGKTPIKVAKSEFSALKQQLSLENNLNRLDAILNL